MKFQEWLKGGSRYRRLKQEVERQLQGEEVVEFLIGLQGKVGKGFALNPLSVLRKEFAIALAGNDVVVMKVKRPAIFGSKVSGIWYSVPPSEVKRVDQQLVVGNETFTPFPFHRRDAEKLVQMARKRD